MSTTNESERFDVEHVHWLAHLARLHLTDDETAEMSGQLDAIVAYVAQLQEVDTDGVEPMAHPIELANIFRDDEPQPSFTVDEALQNAPKKGDGFFHVPAVFD